MSNEAGTGGLGGILRDVGNALGSLFGGGTVDPDRQMSLEVLYGLLGYLAKLDSLVTSHEAEFINHLMDEMRLSMREREIASTAAQRGKSREIDLKTEFQRFRSRYPYGSTECEHLYNALVQLAAADDRLRPKERQFLETLTVELGFEMADLDQRLERFKTSG